MWASAPLFVDFNDFASDSDVAVGIFWILNTQRNVLVPPHVLVLHATFGAVQQNVVSVEFAPDRADVRSSIGHHRRNMSKCLLLEQIFEIFRNSSSHRNLQYD